ncbi:MAG: YheT family hydrolase [Desulfomonilaceae bacterium]
MPVIVQSSYKAPFLCSNLHIQTVVPTLFRKVKGVDYWRERIITPDGDFLDLDWSSVDSDRLAIVLHGLEGNSTRSYVTGMVKTLNQGAWDGLALNFRGCSGEPNRKLRMYHSGETGDLETVIEHVMLKNTKYSQIALVGFSLGGNLILKYLGERGRNLPSFIKAAVTFSVPCDLKSSSDRISEWSNRLYLKRFLKMLHEKIKIKASMAPEKIDLKGYDKIRTLKEFDDRYTAPLHGFRDAYDYYEKASCRQFLPNISVPTLLINAADDPFLSADCYPYEEAEANPNLILEVPEHGGHVGFMAFNPKREYWSETRAVAFMNGGLLSKV